MAVANRGHEDDADRVEHYWLKYCWIGFYEAAGRRAERAELCVERIDSWRLPFVAIDPTFPRRPIAMPPRLRAWRCRRRPYADTPG